MKMTRAVSLVTLGCKVNQYESQLYRENFENNGFEIRDFGEPCDITLINTCVVTKRAEKESRNLIHRSLRISPRVIVTGCYVEKDDEALLEKFPEIEVVKRGKLLNNGLPAGRHGYFQNKINKIHNFSGHTRAFIKIEDGCERFCSYCIIPYLRGAVANRSSKEILKEIEGLVENGYQEFVLTGVDLGAYEGLVSLLTEISKIKGVERIRLSSLEPNEINNSLIDLLSSNPKFCPHLHIPLQSGDDRILRLMNRDYALKDYTTLIEKIGKKIPKVCLTTDIMVGFPGEDSQAFSNTVNAVKEIGFSKVHCFRYSAREKTIASKLPNPVKEEEKRERAENLRLLAEKVSQKIKRSFLGKTLSVLVEGKKRDRYFFGYSENYLPVLIEKEVKTNQIVKVKIGNLKGGYLIGTILC